MSGLLNIASDRSVWLVYNGEAVGNYMYR